MTDFDLPSNFDPNPQRIRRIVRRRVIPPLNKTHLESSFVSLCTTYGQDSQTVLDPVQQPFCGFELKSGLVNMVQASPFCGKASEDANAHLQNFLEVSSIINPRDTTMDNVHLRLFPFSLLGKVKTWFYTN